MIQVGEDVSKRETEEQGAISMMCMIFFVSCEAKGNRVGGERGAEAALRLRSRRKTLGDEEEGE